MDTIKSAPPSPHRFPDPLPASREGILRLFRCKNNIPVSCSMLYCFQKDEERNITWDNRNEQKENRYEKSGMER